MEIANNNLSAILSAKSPSQPSGNEEASESSEESSGFEGTLLSSMMPGAPQTPAQQPGINASGSADPKAGVAIANAARNGGPATKGVEFPDMKRLLDTKSSQSVNGTMSDAFIAGPNSPWKSEWVFGADKPVTGNSDKLQGIAQALAQLQNATTAQANGTGGDESQLSQIQSAIAGLDGELTKVEADVAKASRPQLLSGAEYLTTLQGAQSAGQGDMMGGQGSGQFGSNQSGSFAAKELAAATKEANAKRAGLQLVPGGVSTGKDRLDSIEKSDDANRAPEWTLGVAPQNLVQSNAKQPMAPVVLTGNVVPGSMMRDRLTSDSLVNVSSGISKLNNSGGGEMRIRLNPENLGQLTIHVATNGQGDVGLKVQASSGGAKKILEESMNSLRESLAGQNLVLGRVDVSVLSSNTQSDLNGQNPQQWGQGQQAQMDLSQNSMQGRDGSSRWDRETGSTAENRIARANVSSASFGPSRSRAAGASSSRLDVMA